MAISTGAGLAIAAGVGAAGGIGSALIGSSAAKTAAGEQAQSGQGALDFQKQVWEQEQANQAPYLQAGNTSLASLMKGIESGTFGAGSLPQFKAPTLEEAQQTPGYQFTAQQGSKGILQGAAATGGSITGGTLKALDQYNTNLANTTYGNVFNQALSGYAANLGAQQQMYNQLYQPAALGEGSVQSLNNSGNTVSQNVGNLMTQIGNANAAGTVGSANAWTNGISGATNDISQMILLNKMLNPSSSMPNLDAATLSNLGITTPSAGFSVPTTPPPTSTYPSIGYDPIPLQP